jgi:hypothetical protein
MRRPHAVGESLTILGRDDPSGRAWVRDAGGQEGWVPLASIETPPNFR